MVNITCHSLSALKELQVTDLEEFQHYLIKGVEGFKSVPKGLMENPDEHGTVDRMVESYGLNGAVEITLKILEKINQNQLTEDLRQRISLRESSTEKTTFTQLIKDTFPP